MEFLTTKIGLAVLVPFMVLFEWSVDPVAPVDRANFGRIKNGMATKEVEKILGPLAPGETGADVFGHNVYTTEIWVGRGCAIVVSFTNDKVTNKFFFQPSVWERTKDWMYERYRHPAGGFSKRFKAAT